MENVNGQNDVVVSLPRGGYLINTPAGQIQFGAPPETIKDTMVLPEGVPQIFVLTKEMFNRKKGISIAEIEFPLYYNFYLKQKKTYILCQKEQFSRLKSVLQDVPVYLSKKKNMGLIGTVYQINNH